MSNPETAPRKDHGFDRKVHTQAKCEACKFIMFYDKVLGPLRAMRCPGCKGPVARTDGRLFLNPKYTTPEAKPFRTSEPIAPAKSRHGWANYRHDRLHPTDTGRHVSTAPEVSVREVTPGELEYARAVAEKANRWVPGCGGREVEYKNRNGVRVLYVFNPATQQHGWLNLDSDIVFSTSELSAPIGATI